MENLIFEEVDGDKIKFSNLIKRIKTIITNSECQKDGCDLDLKNHLGKKEIDFNFIDCEDGTILWWHSDFINTEKRRKRRIIWQANRSEKQRKLLAKYKTK